AGEFDTPTTETMLRGWLEPLLERNIDALVLGCTHYPIVRPLIERIVGPGVRVIDPAPAIARQLQRVLHRDGIEAPNDQRGDLTCYTSGDTAEFSSMMQRLGLSGTEVRQAKWEAGKLTLP
ncbi:MAG: aspartate/glutamate racemase family protein, partial [Flavobacteriales bacterium]|nr:aspartate/glutamate racemase family protein [Flavobacteriales bacterium]